jgi:hypothetical protein
MNDKWNGLDAATQGVITAQIKTGFEDPAEIRAGAWPSGGCLTLATAPLVTSGP